MKKVIIILIVAAVACTSVFAADIQLGVMQNLLTTNLLVDAEFDNFGIEGAVGASPILLVGNGIEAVTNLTAGTEGSGYFNVFGATANAYWKAYKGNKFSLRLGIQTDVVGFFAGNGNKVFGTYGPSVGFNFKFNEKFGMNITGTVPAMAVLQLFGDDVAQYGAYYISDVKIESIEEGIGEFFLTLFEVLGATGAELARISFKWSI